MFLEILDPLELSLLRHLCVGLLHEQTGSSAICWLLFFGTCARICLWLADCIASQPTLVTPPITIASFPITPPRHTPPALETHRSIDDRRFMTQVGTSHRIDGSSIIGSPVTSIGLGGFHDGRVGSAMGERLSGSARECTTATDAHHGNAISDELGGGEASKGSRGLGGGL